MRSRSFTVPRGAKFVCLPLDGSSQLIAEEGCQVTIRVDEPWERAAEAAREAAREESERG